MRVRTIELWRAGWGIALLTSPAAVLGRLHRVELDRRAIVTVRILGARHLIQALLCGLRPGPRRLTLGVWVDSIHAVTAVGFGLIDRERARPALTDAAVAATWAAFGRRDRAAARRDG